VAITETPKVMTSGFIQVADEVSKEVESYTVSASTEPDFDAMTPLELREWARANGFGSKIKNTRDKEKLLKIIRG
jgi:hypothetical protein